MSKAGMTIDLSGLYKRFSPQELRRKQAAFAHRVGFDANKYCPEDEGTLRDSMPISSNFEAGLIVWNTPYAQTVHDLDHVRVVKNPNAKPQWPEYAKQERLDDLKEFAREIMRK